MSREPKEFVSRFPGFKGNTKLQSLRLASRDDWQIYKSLEILIKLLEGSPDISHMAYSYDGNPTQSSSAIIPHIAQLPNLRDLYWQAKPNFLCLPEKSDSTFPKLRRLMYESKKWGNPVCLLRSDT